MCKDDAMMLEITPGFLAQLAQQRWSVTKVMDSDSAGSKIFSFIFFSLGLSFRRYKLGYLNSILACHIEILIYQSIQHLTSLMVVAFVL